jgi:meiotically up-regulated gene 157 (Mug157) protein
LANFLHLSYKFWESTNITTYFDSKWKSAADRVYSTIKEQQSGIMEIFKNAPYHFQRNNPNPTDSQMLGGLGAPGARCGLVRSNFRPSDDSTTLPYLIPANAYAVVALKELSSLWLILGDSSKASYTVNLFSFFLKLVFEIMFIVIFSVACIIQ